MGLKDWALPNAQRMEVVHPVTGATGFFLTISGEDTTAYRDEVLAIMRGYLTDPVEDSAKTARQIDDTCRLAAVCITGWTNDEAFDGPYSPERALQLMRMPELAWLREQVQDFKKDRSTFFRPAS